MRMLSTNVPVVCAVGSGDTLLTLFENATYRIAKTSVQPKTATPENAFEYTSEEPGALLLCSPLVTTRAYEGYVFGTALWGASLVTLHAQSSTVVQVTDVSYLGCVTALAFNEMGTLLAVGGSTGIVGVYEVVSDGGKPMIVANHTMPPKVVLRGQSSAITTLAFDRDSKVCATGSAGGSVCVHLLQNGRCLCSIDPPSETRHFSDTAPVKSVSFTRHTDIAVVFSEDHYVRLFSMNGRPIDRIHVGRDDIIRCIVLFDESCKHNDLLAVFDPQGVTYITTRIFTMPQSRVECRWDLPTSGTVFNISDVQIWYLKSSNAAAQLPQAAAAAAAAAAASQGSSSSSSSSSGTETGTSCMLLLCTKRNPQQDGPTHVVCSIGVPM